MNWDKSWLRSVFSEADGTGSNTRVCCFLIIAVSLGLLIYLAVKRPDTFVVALPLITTFDVAVCGALYGINKGADLAGNIFGKDGGK